MIQTRLKLVMNKPAAALIPKVGIRALKKSHGGRSLGAGLQRVQKVNLAARLVLVITNGTDVNLAFAMCCEGTRDDSPLLLSAIQVWARVGNPFPLHLQSI